MFKCTVACDCLNYYVLAALSHWVSRVYLRSGGAGGEGGFGGGCGQGWIAQSVFNYVLVQPSCLFSKQPEPPLFLGSSHSSVEQCSQEMSAARSRSSQELITRVSRTASLFNRRRLQSEACRPLTAFAPSLSR